MLLNLGVEMAQLGQHYCEAHWRVEVCFLYLARHQTHQAHVKDYHLIVDERLEDCTCDLHNVEDHIPVMVEVSGSNQCPDYDLKEQRDQREFHLKV